MDIILVKIALAPLIVVAASLLARRLGPGAGGIFVGLPSTSLPFLLTVWLGYGPESAAKAAAGGVVGQLCCALFCVTYSRTVIRYRPLVAMPAAIAVAATASYPLLLAHDLVWPLVLGLVAAVAGLASWPATSGAEGTGRRGRHDLVVRATAAGTVVATTSTLAPHIGETVAGAISSLPVILMIMAPAVHAAEGPGAASTLARGTLSTIPGTAAFLTCAALLIGPVGFGPAVALGLLALGVTTYLVKIAAGNLGRLASGRHTRRRSVRSLPTPEAAPQAC